MLQHEKLKYFLLFVVSLAFLFLSGCAGRSQILWENDFVAPNGRDDNYTNGIAFVHSPDEETTIAIGQQFYTPDDLRTSDPIPEDRPYAGWLGAAYTHHNVQKTSSGKDSKESLGGRVGCTGVCSGAETIQKFVHNDLDAGVDPQGWHNQIDMEPTAAITYEYMYRPFYYSVSQSTQFDAIGSSRGDLGTDITRGTLSGTLRYGYNLPRDFGADVIEPTSEVSLREESSDPFRVYLFTRADGKATLYNVFIDNHLFNEGTGLDLETWGADLASGLMFHFAKYRLGFQFIYRTKEFEGDGSHRFGSLTLGWDI